MAVRGGLGCRAGLALLAGGLIVLPAARGQVATGDSPGREAQAARELKQLHEKLARPSEVTSVADARQALEKLKNWNLAADKLEPEQRAWLLEVALYADLAAGDAGGAAEQLPKLEREFPDARPTLHAAWQVAVATGDAELAQRTLNKLKEQGAASEKALSARAARLEMVGRAAPDATVKVSGGKPIAIQPRDGVVLLIDFWSLDKKPDEKRVQALRELYAEYGKPAKVQFLGVNTGPSADLKVAEKFAADNSYEWPQYYEAAPRSEPVAPLFHVSSAAGQVLVDRDGNVRAVGLVTEPEFVYALRAAVSEAAGEYLAVRPKTTAGVEAQARAARKPAAPEAQGKQPEKPVASGDLPRNRDAESLLDQARVYLKTGRKTDAKKLLQEIVEKYPGTWEARDAQERLDAL